MYSEKARKFCEISTLLFSYVVPVKSKVEILQDFVAFSEYMNFTTKACNAFWIDNRKYIQLRFHEIFMQNSDDRFKMNLSSFVFYPLKLHSYF